MGESETEIPDPTAATATEDVQEPEPSDEPEIIAQNSSAGEDYVSSRGAPVAPSDERAESEDALESAGLPAQGSAPELVPPLRQAFV